MGTDTVTLGSTLRCPHGGAVQIAGANVRTRANGSFVARATDTFTISGCPFQIPAPTPIPSPCVTVRWLITDMRVRTNGVLTLSRSSVGLCLSAAGVPQGPVSVVATQARVRSQ
jgi:hypothetical protein